MIAKKPSAFSTVAESLLASGLHVRFRARGRSMAPAVRDGETITVAPIEANEVRIGDVVLCETRRGPLAHRVQRVERDASGELRFVLRGDASLEDDRPIAANGLRGRIVSLERDGRVVELGGLGGALGRRLLVAAVRARAALFAAAASVRVALAPSR